MKIIFKGKLDISIIYKFGVNESDWSNRVPIITLKLAINSFLRFRFQNKKPQSLSEFMRFFGLRLVIVFLRD